MNTSNLYHKREAYPEKEAEEAEDRQGFGLGVMRYHLCGGGSHAGKGEERVYANVS